MPVDYRKWDHIEVRSDFVMNPPMLWIWIRFFPELLGKVPVGSGSAYGLFDKLTKDTKKISNLGVEAQDHKEEDLTSYICIKHL